MTAAVVLAAGLGRRLATVTTLPKWLTPVRGTCPAEAQLAALAATDDVESVYVVVSDSDREIERFVAPWRDRLGIEVVPNPDAATRNNWYSALIGLERCLAGRHAETVLLNSDLFAVPEWFVASIATIRATPGRAALAVDTTRGQADEEMKVALDDSGTRITGIGKSGIADPGGEYVGLARWSAAAALELCNVLRGFGQRPECADHWYEHAIGAHLVAGAHYAVSPVASTSWVEIDDRRDLESAIQLVDPG